MNTTVAQEGSIWRSQWRGRPYLVSPVVDFLLAGGAAIAAIVLFALVVPRNDAGLSTYIAPEVLSSVMFWAILFINYPHFMVSYQLLYGNYRSRLRALEGNREMWWRTLNAGVISPILLLLFLGYAAMEAADKNLWWIGLSLQAMYFFVGWHYCKQAFGVFMMLSSLKRIFYTPETRRILLINAYTVWLFSWAMPFSANFLRGAIPNATTDANPYGFLIMPAGVQIVLGIAATVTSLLAARAIYQHAKKTGARPSMTALVGYLSMYSLWALAGPAHPEWMLYVPVFHSAQYLMFVIAYKRGELNVKLAEDPAAYKKLRNRAQEFFGYAFLLGIFSFSIIPHLIDGGVASTSPGLLPPDLFGVLFLVFINIHHYFIDNAIWRRENKEVGQYLVGWRHQAAK
jgi:hypothetical protein